MNGRGIIGVTALAAALLVSACSGDYSSKDDVAGPKGPPLDPNKNDDSLFGPGGISVSNLVDGRVTGEGEGGSLPVNKYLWQASLDTLAFLPLSSTDPFTGVIATDWSASPDAPGERYKVTVYIVNPQLAASALKVGVYRQALTQEGVWVPAAVSPETPRRLEDAILTRARQIRIAELEAENS